MAEQNLSRPRAVPSNFVEMEHPDVDSTFKTSPAAVPHWEDRGWKVVGAKASKKAAASGSEA